MQDFEGQGRAENLSRIIITVAGVIGFIYGGYVQQFSMTVYCLGAGFLLAALLTVPPWPCYRRKPLSWQKARYEVGEDGKPKEKEKRK